jgi:DNA segregation ATPase FtsK/SpoIIIE-like protein
MTHPHNDKLEAAPCPFCADHDSLLIEHVEGTVVHPAYYVKCDNCGAVGPTTDKGNHVELWNRRAPPALDAEGLPPLRDDIVSKLNTRLAWMLDPDQFGQVAPMLAAISAQLARQDQQPAQRASIGDDPDRDPLYDKAVAVVRAHQRASLSLVQRTLLIGYNRTARLFEAMEKAGVVSPFDEHGHRTVLAAAPSPAQQGKETTK